MNNTTDSDLVSEHLSPHTTPIDCDRQCDCSQQCAETDRDMKARVPYSEQRHETESDLNEHDRSPQCSVTGSDIKGHTCTKHNPAITGHIPEKVCSSQHLVTGSVVKDQDFSDQRDKIVSDIKDHSGSQKHTETGSDTICNDCSREPYVIGSCDMSEGDACLEQLLVKPSEKREENNAKKNDGDLSNSTSLISSLTGGSGDSIGPCYRQEYEVRVAYRVELQHTRGNTESVNGRSPVGGHDHTQKGFHRRNALRQALFRIHLQRHRRSKVSDQCDVLTNGTDKPPSAKSSVIHASNEDCKTDTCAEQEPGGGTVTINSDSNKIDIPMPIIDDIAGIDFWDEFSIDAHKQDHVNIRYALNRDYYQLAWIDLGKDNENCEEIGG